MTVAEAKDGRDWPLVRAAMECEVKGKFIDNQALEVVPRIPGLRVLKTKWVLNFSALDDGSVPKVKVRLVACSYRQREGVDFPEVFAATLASTSFRILCAIIAAENLETDTIDAVKGFTQTDIDAEIF